MSLVVAPRWLAGLKRLAAFILACCFFLPLYSCSTQGKPPGVARSASAPAAAALAAVRAPASAGVAPRSGSPASSKLPERLEFSPYEAFSWDDAYSMAGLLVFFWPAVLELAVAVAPTAGVCTTQAGPLLCLGSAAALAWLLWRAHFLPGYQLEVGMPLAALALLLYAVPRLARGTPPASG